MSMPLHSIQIVPHQKKSKGIRLSIFPFLLSCLLTSSCVTVNVNFPEGAVQKATDDYVKELYRAKGKSTQPPNPQTKAEFPLLPLSLLTNWIIPNTHADETKTFQVATEKSREIQTRQAARLEEILEHKRAGLIGESSDGMVSLRDNGEAKPLLKKKIEKLIDQENMDRKELYSEVLRANSLSTNWLAQIRKSFGRSFQNLSPSGTPIEMGDGKWERKP